MFSFLLVCYCIVYCYLYIEVDGYFSMLYAEDVVDIMLAMEFGGFIRSLYAWMCFLCRAWFVRSIVAPKLSKQYC